MLIMLADFYLFLIVVDITLWELFYKRSKQDFAKSFLKNMIKFYRNLLRVELFLLPLDRVDITILSLLDKVDKR